MSWIILNSVWSVLTGFALGYYAYYYRRYENQEYLIILVYVQLFVIAQVVGASYIELTVGFVSCVLTLWCIKPVHVGVESIRLYNMKLKDSTLQKKKKGV